MGNLPCRKSRDQNDSQNTEIDKNLASKSEADDNDSKFSLLDAVKDHSVVKVDVDLPYDFKNKLAFMLYNVFTPKECKEYIAVTEKRGYEKSLVNIGGGKQIKALETRNSDRCIWDSHEESEKIWKRIKMYIPSTWKQRKVIGLNERLRFLRYSPGEYFKPHMDGEYKRDNGETSYITVQLYLNQGFSGGETTFMSRQGTDRKPVVPQTGAVLIFQHDIVHEGSELTGGVKYAVRTDVMYDGRVSV